VVASIESVEEEKIIKENAEKFIRFKKLVTIYELIYFRV